MPELSNRQVRIERIFVALVVLLVIVLVGLRSTFGVSLYDDSHYVTVCLRMSQGARPFVDEMSVQSLGFLPATAFVWLWTHLFGTTGLVTAFRLFYVALATAVGLLAYVQLRRVWHPLVAALAVAVPLLCPPFNLFAPGYNQMTTLGFITATALAHRAWLDRSRLAAAGCGVALVFASITYPPLSIAAIAMMLILSVATRDRRVIVPLFAASAVAAVVLLGGLLSWVSISEIRHGLAYATANVSGFSSPAAKIQRTVMRLSDALGQPILWPMWIAAALACVPRVPRRLRAVILLALPLLAATRSVQALTQGLRVFGVTAGAWLITFTIATVVPVSAWAIAGKRRDLVHLLVITVPVSLIGFLTVAYSTDAPWLRGVAVIGLVSGALAVLATWACALEDLWGESLLVVAAIVVIAIVVGLLWSESIDDGRPVAMSGYMNHGLYAGMHMSPGRERELLALEAAGKRWVRTDSRVTFYGERQAYLVSGGRIYTNAVWLYPSETASFALAYFAEHGAYPDVVFTDQFAMRLRHQLPYENAAQGNSFVAFLLEHYRLVDEVADFGVWVKK